MPIDNRRARELAAESLPQNASPLAVGHWEAVIMRACEDHAAPALEALRVVRRHIESDKVNDYDSVWMIRQTLAQYDPVKTVADKAKED